MKNKLFLIILAFLSLFLIYYYSPLLNGVVMGVVFAYVAKPIKNRLRFGETLSSAISTVLILLPISFLMFYGILQGLNQLIYLLTHQKELSYSIAYTLREAGLPEKYVAYVISAIPSVESYAKQYIKFSALNLTVKATMFFMNFLISAVVCFYALRDGERFADSMLSLIPRKYRDNFKELFMLIDETLVSLWFGNFAFAIIVGILSIPFFLIFGVPYIPLLSGLMFLAALIPVFAEWMVLLPVSAFLATKSLILAIWFLILGVVFMYILPELFLRPYFLGYASKIHPMLILLSFIGGAIAGGASGFFIAPTLTAIATAFYNFTAKSLGEEDGI